MKRAYTVDEIPPDKISGIKPKEKVFYVHMVGFPDIPIFGSIGSYQKARAICDTYNGKGSGARKKPCKYCDTVGKTIITIDTDDRVFIEVSGGYLRAFDEDYPGFVETEKINYCPMCGRYLWKSEGGGNG